MAVHPTQRTFFNAMDAADSSDATAKKQKYRQYLSRPTAALWVEIHWDKTLQSSDKHTAKFPTEKNKGAKNFNVGPKFS